MGILRRLAQPLAIKKLTNNLSATMLKDLWDFGCKSCQESQVLRLLNRWFFLQIFDLRLQVGEDRWHFWKMMG